MCTRKTSLSLLLFFVSIIYFTIRKVNPLCEKMYYSPVAVRKTMPHGPVMYITIYSRRAALAGSAPTHKPMAVFFAYCRIVATDIHFISLYAIS